MNTKGERVAKYIHLLCKVKKTIFFKPIFVVKLGHFIPPSTLHDNIQPCLLTLALVPKVMRVTISIGFVPRGQSDGVNKTD